MHAIPLRVKRGRDDLCRATLCHRKGQPGHTLSPPGWLRGGTNRVFSPCAGLPACLVPGYWSRYRQERRSADSAVREDVTATSKNTYFEGNDRVNDYFCLSIAPGQ